MSCMTHAAPAPPLTLDPRVTRKLALVLALAASAYRCDAMPLEPAPAFRAPHCDDTPTTPHPIAPLPPLPKVWP